MHMWLTMYGLLLARGVNSSESSLEPGRNGVVFYARLIEDTEQHRAYGFLCSQLRARSFVCIILLVYPVIVPLACRAAKRMLR